MASQTIQKRCVIVLGKAGLLFILFLCLQPKVTCELAKKHELVKHSRETNPVNFVRLLFLRLVYGVATLMGFNDGLSEVANGAFVPPGMEDDYGGFGLDNRDSDDYSYNYDDY